MWTRFDQEMLALRVPHGLLVARREKPRPFNIELHNYLLKELWKITQEAPLKPNKKISMNIVKYALLYKTI